jgi:hypothetical protein
MVECSCLSVNEYQITVNDCFFFLGFPWKIRDNQLNIEFISFRKGILQHYFYITLNSAMNP